MTRHLSLVILVFATLIIPAAALAQREPDLVVRLTDRTGAGIPRVVIIVRDRSGKQLLSQAVTDDHGEATIERVPMDMVRVAVMGTTRAGIPLVQKGLDAPGVLVFLDMGEHLVDLMAEQDGVVQLNPATSVALEGDDGLETTIPTAIIAPTLSPATPAPIASPQAPLDAHTSEPERIPSLMTSLGIILLAIIVGAIIGVLALNRRAER